MVGEPSSTPGGQTASTGTGQPIPEQKKDTTPEGRIYVVDGRYRVNIGDRTFNVSQGGRVTTEVGTNLPWQSFGIQDPATRTIPMGNLPAVSSWSFRSYVDPKTGVPVTIYLKGTPEAVIRGGTLGLSSSGSLVYTSGVLKEAELTSPAARSFGVNVPDQPGQPIPQKATSIKPFVAPRYESSTFFVTNPFGPTPVSSARQPFGSIPGTWKPSEMVGTFRNAQGQFFSVDISRGVRNWSSDMTPVTGWIWTAPSEQKKAEYFTPEAIIPKSSVFNLSTKAIPYVIRTDIGTRQDLFAPIDFADKRTRITAVIPGIERTPQMEWKEYYKDPLGHLGYAAETLMNIPIGFITSIAVGTIQIPGAVSSLVAGGTQGLYYIPVNIMAGLSGFVEKTKTLSWTPKEAALVGGGVAGSIFTSEFIYKPAFENLILPRISKTTPVSLERGELVLTPKQGGWTYQIELAGISKARTTIAGVPIAETDIIPSRTTFVGFIPDKPIGDVEVFGLAGGTVKIGGKIKPTLAIGELGKEFETLGGLRITPGASYSIIGGGTDVSASKFFLSKIYTGPSTEGSLTTYESFSKITSAGGMKGAGYGMINILDKTGQFQGFTQLSGINYELSVQMQELAATSLAASQAAAMSSSIASASSKLSITSALAYNLLGVVPSKTQGGRAAVMTSNIQITEPLTTIKLASLNVQIEKTTPMTTIATMTKQFSPQAYIEQQTTKTLDLTKTLGTTRTMDMTRVADMTKALEATRILDLTRTVDMTRTTDMTKTLDLTKTIGATRTLDMTRTLDLSRVLQITPEITPGIIVTTPPPPPPPPPRGFGTGSLFGEKKRTSKGGRKPTRYTPSIISLAFNIRGKMPKGIETGVRIRPMLYKKKR